MEFRLRKGTKYKYRLGLVTTSMAAQYVVTHPQPSHNINYLSFFALKREFLSFFYPFLCSENSTVSQAKMNLTPIFPTLAYFRQEGRVKCYIHGWLPIAVQLPLNEDYRNLEKSLLFGRHHMYLKLQ